MKKYLFVLGSLMMSLMMTSCGGDDEDIIIDTVTPPGNTQSYVKVENATYNSGTMPQATTTTQLNATISSTTMTKGQTNIVKIVKDHVYKRFFIGVKGQTGYYVYTPATTRADDDDEFYTIPISSGDANGSYIIQISGEDENGDITQPYETEAINRTDSSAGALVSGISLSGGNLLNMKYDDKDRLTSFSQTSMGHSINTTINYGTTITIVETERYSNEGFDGYEGYSETLTYTATTNVKGYISSMKCKGEDYSATSIFDYDNQEHLTKITTKANDEGDTFTVVTYLTWKENNLISYKVSSTDSYGGEIQSITYSYGEYDNQLHQFYYGSPFDSGAFGAAYAAGLLGVVSQKLPVSSQWNAEGSYQYTYSYTFNENGSIKTQSVNGTDLTYSYAK